MTMRIGLFGGSFDPVHCGHLRLACAAMKERNYEQLFWIPAFCSPFKDSRETGASGTHRAEMIRLAIQPFSGMVLCDYELTKKERSYSVQTVRHFKSQFPSAELEWLLGADALQGLPSWRESKKLAEELRFIAAPRAGVQLIAPDGFQVHWLSMQEVPVSSTSIKKNLISKKITKDIPDTVMNYIRAHQLYHKASV